LQEADGAMKRIRMKFTCAAALAGALVCAYGSKSGAGGDAMSAEIHPEIWPIVDAPDLRNNAVERRVADLLSRMTLEEKVGQVIQADIASIEPDDLLTYRLGSILNGGNSAPGGDNHAPPSEYLKLADAFYDASVNPAGGAAAIPVLWGTDAVHGHSNIVGATLFPHNIGLGAARDRDLIRRIGEITAREVQVTGMDWTFAPTLAVVRDDRWGRSYEGYSEDPEIVREYAAAFIEGVQGAAGTDDFLSETRIIATAKHFVGDGGTRDGVDQGDNQATEEALRDLHAAGYPPAIAAGVQTVMASFNSWRGEKLHGHKGLLTDVLRGRMNFDGFVVGDWNGHGQVDGCSNASCPAAFNAGLDMFMAPDSWRELYANTLEQVKSGEISQVRLDEAVSRILRVKMRYGAFERGRPSSRSYAGDHRLLGAPEHRAVAREAVRKSLVLLKNNNGVLPLNPGGRILVAGDGADNIGKQSGGWSITWQGEGNSNTDFPNGQSIYAGLKEAIEAAGGTAVLSEDGTFSDAPDAAIVVFGESPYAEFQGDRKNLNFDDGASLQIMQRLRTANVPVVAVFLSGRPMYVNPEINAADAFVAAFLPGSEGGGIADLLLRKPDGSVNYDFRGKLSFSWPQSPYQTPLNRGDAQYEPLFAYGYGLTYADSVAIAGLDETERAACAAGSGTEFVRAGRAQRPYRLTLVSGVGATAVDGPTAQTPDGALRITSVNRKAQEDARELVWTGPASFIVQGVQQDLRREANARMTVAFSYEVTRAPGGGVRIGLRCADDCSDALIDMTAEFAAAAGKGWRWGEIALGAVADSAALSSVTAPFLIESDNAFAIRIADVSIAMPGGAQPCE
jgi:beta-glucosidase